MKNLTLRKTNLTTLTYFCIKKVSKRIINWIIVLLSSITIFSLIFYFETISTTYQTFLKYFNYFVLIFINLFLLFFIVINTIKNLSDEFKNSFFLLLIVRPYSRSAVILCKIISLIFSASMLVIITSLSGIISIVASNYIFYHMLKVGQFVVIIKFIAYSEVVILVLTTSVLFMTLLFSSQAVYLISTIFASLFLLGGMPYNLFTQIENSLVIKFNHMSDVPFTIKQIKSEYYFVDALEEKKLEYPNISKIIFDFYNNNFDIDDITDIKNHGLDQKQATQAIEYYKQFGLFDSNQDITDVTLAGNITQWPGTYHNVPIKDIISNHGGSSSIYMDIKFTNHFKSLSSLNKNNIYQNELIRLVNNNQASNYFQQQQNLYYLISQDTKKYSYNTVDYNNSFFRLNSDAYKENHWFTDLSECLPPEQIIASILKTKINGDYASSYSIDDEDLINRMQQVFLDPAYLYFLNLEDNIIYKVYLLKILENYSIVQDENWNNYLSYSNFYALLSKINVIEQWNQLWTWFTSNDNTYWFKPHTNGEIDFQADNNLLMSYQDFPLNLDNNSVIKKGQNYMNIKMIPLIYLLLSTILFAGSFVIINKRNIL